MVVHPQPRDLVIELLGHFQIRLGDPAAESHTWRKQKPRQLFALLVNAPYLRLPRSEVYAHLWPDHPNPGNNLHVTIHHLRKLCDELPTPDIDIQLSTEQVILQLPEHVWLDVRVFDEAARALLQHGGEPSEFRDVLALYRGPFLPDDEAELWTLALREHLAQLFAQLTLAYADLLARHDAQSASDALQRLISFDPTHEGAVARLMLLAQRQGQRAMVQALYDQLREALATRLDLEPMEMTEQIAAACLHDQVKDLPLVDWGLLNYRERLRTQLPFVPVQEAPIGREEQLEAILAAVDDIPRGHGGCIGIAGSAGMGKLQLAHAALTRLYTQDWIIIAGRPLASDRTLAYEPLIEALAEYLRWSPPLKLDNLAEAAMIQLLGPAVPEDWRPADPPARIDSQSLLFLGLMRLLEAISQHGPVAVFIDDVHRADPDTLEFLIFLSRRLGTLRILFLLTYRPEEVDMTGAGIQYWQEGVRQGLIHVFTLKPLDRAACLRLLATLDRPLPPALAEQLIERSGGNPFFLRELGRYVSTNQALDAADVGRSALPQAILDAVQTRVSRLSTAARAALEVGAVAMPYWTADLIEHAQHMAPSVVERAIEELLAAQLIREAGYGLAIRQSLVQEVLYRHMSRPRRLRLHGLVAEYLVQQGDIPPAPIWYHLTQAEASEERQPLLIEYGLLVAEQALEKAADDEARRAYEQVLAVLEASGGAPEQWIMTLFGLARLTFRHAQYPESRQYCERVAEWTQDRPLDECERRNHLGWLDYRISHLAAAREHFEAVHKMAPLHSRQWVEAQVGDAVILFVYGQVSTAKALIEEAMPYFDLAHPSVVQARGLFLAGSIAFDDGDRTLANSFFDRSIEHAEQAGDLLYSALMRTNLANTLVRSGELRTAQTLVQEALKVSTELGNRDYEGIQYAYLTWVSMALGELTTAIEYYHKAIARLEEINNIELHCDVLTMRAIVARAQRDWATAQQLLHETLELIGDKPYMRSKVDVYHELVMLALYGPQRDLAKAAEYAELGLAAGRNSGHSDSLALSLLAQAELQSAQGRPIEAATTAYEAVAILKRQGIGLTLIDGYLTLTRIALASADLTLARTELEKAKALALQYEAGMAYAHAVALGAELESRREHSQQSRETDDYNEDWLEPILTGHQSLAERARELGVSRTALRRAYHRYQQTLTELSPEE